MSRRRSSRGELVVISWRDIPAQVTASRGRDKEKALLTARFQHAIDRAAAVAGLTDTDSYVNEWRRTVRPIDGELLAEAETEADRLEQSHPKERIERLVRMGGLDPEAPTAPDPLPNRAPADPGATPELPLEQEPS